MIAVLLGLSIIGNTQDYATETQTQKNPFQNAIQPTKKAKKIDKKQ